MPGTIRPQHDFRNVRTGILLRGQKVWLSIAMPRNPYHQRASECLQFAEGASDMDERTTWRELALCWLRLSEHAEKFRYAEKNSDTARAA